MESMMHRAADGVISLHAGKNKDEQFFSLDVCIQKHSPKSEQWIERETER